MTLKADLITRSLPSVIYLLMSVICVKLKAKSMACIFCAVAVMDWAAACMFDPSTMTGPSVSHQHVTADCCCFMSINPQMYNSTIPQKQIPSLCFNCILHKSINCFINKPHIYICFLHKRRYVNLIESSIFLYISVTEITVPFKDPV